MNLIIDAQLPQSIQSAFPGHHVVHANDLSEGKNVSDKQINDYSMKEKAAVITKDSDFYYSYIFGSRPYKLVFVKLGNKKIKDLKMYFESNASRILDLLNEYSFIVLEEKRIRVLN